MNKEKVIIIISDEIGAGKDYQYECLLNECKKIGLGDNIKREVLQE